MNMDVQKPIEMTKVDQRSKSNKKIPSIARPQNVSIYFQNSQIGTIQLLTTFAFGNQKLWRISPKNAKRGLFIIPNTGILKISNILKKKFEKKIEFRFYFSFENKLLIEVNRIRIGLDTGMSVFAKLFKLADHKISKKKIAGPQNL